MTDNQKSLVREYLNSISMVPIDLKGNTITDYFGNYLEYYINYNLKLNIDWKELDEEVYKFCKENGLI